MAQQKMSPPPPQDMDPTRALGLWRSTFGAVKIEPDAGKGGIQSGAVQGVWVYQRQGQEVVGYFSGNLRGNVLEFRWQEPNNPPLTGAGYIVFEQTGRQYSGRWWSDKRDRVGDWNGWRQAGAQQQPQYGGAQYGGGGQYPPAQQPPQQGYQPQQGYPPPQQYPQQPPQQQPPAQQYPPPQQQPYQPPAQQPYQPPAQQYPPPQQQPYQPTQPQPYYPPPRA